MRDWRISRFQSIQVYHRSLLGTHLSHFAYENPDLYYKKDQEAAVTDQVLQLLQQMLTLKSHQHTNFTVLQTQISYYLLNMTYSAHLSSLYQKVLQAVQNKDYQQNQAYFLQLSNQIEHLQQQNQHQQIVRHVNHEKRHKNILNKADFTLNRVKQSFFNQFHALDAQAQSTFLQSNDLSYREVRMMQHASREEWMQFVQKITQNQQIQSNIQAETAQNPTAAVPTTAPSQALQILEQTGGTVWQTVKEAYATHLTERQTLLQSIAQVAQIAPTDFSHASSVNLTQMQDLLQFVQQNLAEAAQTNSPSAAEKETAEKFQSLLQQLDICILSHEIIAENAEIMQQSHEPSTTPERMLDMEQVHNLAQQILAIAPNKLVSTSLNHAPSQPSLLHAAAMRQQAISILQGSNITTATHSMRSATNSVIYSENNKENKRNSQQINNQETLQFVQSVRENMLQNLQYARAQQVDYRTFFAQSMLQNTTFEQFAIAQCKQELTSYLLENNPVFREKAMEMVQNSQKSAFISHMQALPEQEWRIIELALHATSLRTQSETASASSHAAQSDESATSVAVAPFTARRDLVVQEISSNTAAFQNFISIIQGDSIAKTIFSEYFTRYSPPAPPALPPIESTAFLHDPQTVVPSKAGFTNIDHNIAITTANMQISQFIKQINTAISYFTHEEWATFQQDLHANLQTYLQQSADATASQTTHVAHLQQLTAVAQMLEAQQSEAADASTPQNVHNYSVQRMQFMQFLTENAQIAGEILNLQQSNTQAQQLLSRNFSATEIEQFHANIAHVQHLTQEASDQGQSQIAPSSDTTHNLAITTANTQISQFIEQINTAISYFTHEEWATFQQNLHANLQTYLQQTTTATTSQSTHVAHLQQLAAMVQMLEAQQGEAADIPNAQNMHNSSVQRMQFMQFLTENAQIAGEILNLQQSNTQAQQLLSRNFSATEIEQFHANIAHVQHLTQQASEQGQAATEPAIAQANNSTHNIAITTVNAQISQFIEQINTAISYFTHEEWATFQQDLHANLQTYLQQSTAVTTSQTTHVAHLQQLAAVAQMLEAQQGAAVGTSNTQNAHNSSVQRMQFMQFLTENAQIAGEILNLQQSSTQTQQLLARNFSVTEIEQFHANIAHVQHLTQEASDQGQSQIAPSSDTTHNLAITTANAQISQFIEQINTAISYFTHEEWAAFQQDLHINLQTYLQQSNDATTSQTTHVAHLQQLAAVAQMLEAQRSKTAGTPDAQNPQNVHNSTLQRMQFMQFLTENAQIAGEILNLQQSSTQAQQLLTRNFSTTEIEQFHANIAHVQHLMQEASAQGQTAVESAIVQSSNTTHNIAITTANAQISQFIKQINTEISYFTHEEWATFQQDLHANLQTYLQQSNDATASQNTHVAHLQQLTAVAQMLEAQQSEAADTSNTQNAHNSSVQRMQFMQFLTENAQIAGEILNLQQSNTQAQQLLSRNFSATEIEQFHANIAHVQHLTQQASEQRQSQIAPSSDTTHNIAITTVNTQISQFIEQINIAISYFTHEEWTAFQQDLYANLQTYLQQSTDATTSQTTHVAHLQQLAAVAQILEAQRSKTAGTPDAQNPQNVHNSTLQRMQFMQFLTENAQIAGNILNLQQSSTQAQQLLARNFSATEIEQFHANIAHVQYLTQQASEQGQTAAKSAIAQASDTTHNIAITTANMQISQFIEQINTELSYFTHEEWTAFQQDLHANLQTYLQQSTTATNSQSTHVAHLQQLAAVTQMLEAQQGEAAGTSNTQNAHNSSLQRMQFMQFLTENAQIAGEILNLQQNSTQAQQLLARNFSATEIGEFHANIAHVQHLTQQASEQGQSQIAPSSDTTHNLAITTANAQISQFIEQINTEISYFTHEEWAAFQQDLHANLQTYLQQNNDLTTSQTTHVAHLQQLAAVAQMLEAQQGEAAGTSNTQNAHNSSLQRMQFMQFLTENAQITGEILNFQQGSTQAQQLLSRNFSAVEIERFHANIAHVQHLTQQASEQGQTAAKSAIAQASDTTHNIAITTVNTQISQFIEQINTAISYFTHEEWATFQQDLHANLQTYLQQSNDATTSQTTHVAHLQQLTAVAQMLEAQQGEAADTANPQNVHNFSLQRMQFMQFLTENAQIAGEILNLQQSNTQAQQLLSRNFSATEIEQFHANIAHVQHLTQQASAQGQAATEPAIAQANNSTHNIAITTVNTQISQFIEQINTAISYFTHEEWATFQQDLHANLQTYLQQSTDATTSQNTHVAHLQQLAAMVQMLEAQQGEAAGTADPQNVHNFSLQRMQFMQFLTENAQIAGEILNLQQSSTQAQQLLARNFSAMEIEQFHANIAHVQHLTQQASAQDFTATQIQTLQSTLLQYDTQTLLNLLENAQNTQIFTQTELAQIVTPTMQVLQSNLHEVLQEVAQQTLHDTLHDTSHQTLHTTSYLRNISHLSAQNIAPIEQASSVPVLEFTQSAPLSSVQTLSNFGRMQQKISLYRQIAQGPDIAHIHTPPTDSHSPYTFANTVVTRKPQADFTPLVNTVSNVVYEKISATQPAPPSPFPPDISMQSKPQAVDTTVIMQTLNQHQKELEKLQNDYKNILKVADISTINRRLEKKIQASTKLQTIRSGF